MIICHLVCVLDITKIFILQDFANYLKKNETNLYGILFREKLSFHLSNEGVLLLVMFQAKACNFTKSHTSLSSVFHVF